MRTASKRLVVTLMMVILSLSFIRPSFAEVTLDELLKRVEAVEKKNEELQKENSSLREEIQGMKDKQSSVAASTSKSDKPDISSETPVVTANLKDGFSIKSPDGAYKLKLSGFVQSDGRIFTNNKKDSSGGTSTFLIRRARLYVTGTVAKDFNFTLVPDFSATSGTVLTYGYMDYTKYPQFLLRAGKFVEPFSVENLQDSKFYNFAELGLPSNLYPQRDIGVQISGGVLNDAFKYAVGIFNGEYDKEAYSVENADPNNDKDVVGRIWISPFKNTHLCLVKGLSLGFAAAYGHEEGASIPTAYSSPGQVNVFTYSSGVTANGPRLRTSPQMTYYYKSFGLLGEYVNSYQDLAKGGGSSLIKNRVNNKAWQISTTYVLTGENASYGGVIPRNNFDPSKGGFGAFELAGRYGELLLDHKIFEDSLSDLNTSISKENAWAIGLNWYLNPNVKLIFDFEQTKFNRGNSATVGAPENRKTENLVTSRVQLGF
ncbi:MAG: hypothetical protein HQL15_03050 [Candidatus Omnitrophica bacterium]|nr:hypothetical protein [Candidatus Omnitrophota bacterium]